MAGLDPAIHVAPQEPIFGFQCVWYRVDTRVKPAHDDLELWMYTVIRPFQPNRTTVDQARL
jgi:hypothetical protein